MKNILLIIIFLLLNVEMGRTAEVKPENGKVNCPHPALVALFFKNLSGNFHGFMKSNAKAEIEDVYLPGMSPDMTLNVYPHINAKGYLICAYHNVHHHPDVPLVYIRMSKAHMNLEGIQRPPAELGPTK